MSFFKTAQIQLGHAMWSAAYRSQMGMPDYSVNSDGTKIDFSKGIGPGQKIENEVKPVENNHEASFGNMKIVPSVNHGSEDDLYANMNYRDNNSYEKPNEPPKVMQNQEPKAEPITEPKVVEEVISNNVEASSAMPIIPRVEAEPITEPKVVEEVISNNVEASSAMPIIPRVEEESSPRGDRPADFSMFFKSDKSSNGGTEFNPRKTAKSLILAEKDIPPEERSIQGRIINYVTAGAKEYSPDIATEYQYPQAYFQQYYEPNFYNGNPYLENQPQPQQQAQPQLPVDYGKFKVDYPNQTPVKPPKAEAEPVEGVEQIAEMVKGATEVLGVEPKEERVKPSFIVTEHPKSEPETEKVPAYDNTELIKNHWWLEGVEKAATKNKCVVQFIEVVDSNNVPIGIIKVNTYTKDATANVYVFNRHKSFIIDYNRNFYDKRVKAFLSINPDDVVEYALQGYTILESDNRDGKNNDKRWNNELLNLIFTAGSLGIDPGKGLYTEGYRNLNKFVNLATIPTNKTGGKEDRTKIVDRLFNSIKAGIFNEVKLYDAYSRFEFYDFDKNSKCFLLLNNSYSQKPIAILYSPNNATIKPGVSYDIVVEEYKKVCTNTRNDNKNNNGKNNG